MENRRLAAGLERLSTHRLLNAVLLALWLSSLGLRGGVPVARADCDHMGVDWSGPIAGINGQCPIGSGGGGKPPTTSSGPVTWNLCASANEFVQLNALYSWGYQLNLMRSSPYWVLHLAADGTSPDPFPYRQPTAVTQCPNPPPPPPGGNPWIFQQFNVWVWVPMALWDGTTTCPPGSAPGSACPPSVGQALQTWVARFVTVNGAQSACSPTLVGYLGYDTWQGCLAWVQQWPIRWDWNDENVNGQRVWGQNYGVAESGVGPAFAVSHTYDYGSSYNPLRSCVRPCQGEQLGPPLPGYPNGAPAFQVQIQTTWRLQLCQQYTSGTYHSPRNCTWIDLTTLGAPAGQPNFVSSNLVPLPVLQYGASPP